MIQDVFDVVVLGGGPSGFAAAVAAARQGARVALIERYPILGGMGTVALVNNFCGAQYDGQRYIIGGVFGELRQRLIRRKALYWLGGFEPYHPDVYNEEMLVMCRNAGVHLLLDTPIESVRIDQDNAASIVLCNGEQMHGKTLVDATGDAVFAARLGVPFTFGRPSDHAVMPLTMCYTAGPVDIEEVRGKWASPPIVRDQISGDEVIFFGGHNPQIGEWLKQARASGELTIQRDHVAAAMSVPLEPDTISVNFGRVNIKDPTDPTQLATADAEGRRQVDEGLGFFRKYLPGFEKLELKRLARQIGVRQSRQLVGLHTLDREDVLSCRQFEDVIAQSHYPIDIHEPYSDKTTLIFLKDGTHYDIPLRCLIPVYGPGNIIVAGRAISATHEAMSSLRVSACSMAIGEAAGVTAALASGGGVAMRDVPAADVQDRLLANGAMLV
jgi:glycine/D-amino acid oxidase-like deaminating enzyme